VAQPPLTAADCVAAALPEGHSWPGRPGQDDLDAIPGCPAVYLLSDACAAPVLLATTQSLKRVLVSRLAEAAQQSRKADLAAITRSVRWRPLATPFEGRWWYYRLARELYPQQYRRMIAFGPAWFLNVDWDARVPDLRVSNQVWSAPGQFVGPWPTQHAARETLDGLWDLFNLCRHPEEVRQTPSGTRCAYAEMGRCDAPCDGSAPLSAYAERCRAAWRFVSAGCGEWIEGATKRMKQAAGVQKYELAALLRQQVRFAEAWRAQWARHARPAEEMRYLLGFRATRRKAAKLFLFRAGHLTDGPLIAARRVGRDAAVWVRNELAKPVSDLAPVVRMEQTWLFSHLLYGSERNAAFLVPLGDDGVPVDLEQKAASWAAAVCRQRGGTQNSAS
jgi:excinuclease UvrABC nuclease subunit